MLHRNPTIDYPREGLRSQKKECYKDSTSVTSRMWGEKFLWEIQTWRIRGLPLVGSMWARIYFYNKENKLDWNSHRMSIDTLVLELRPWRHLKRRVQRLCWAARHISSSGASDAFLLWTQLQQLWHSKYICHVCVPEANTSTNTKNDGVKNGNGHVMILKGKALQKKYSHHS